MAIEKYREHHIEIDCKPCPNLYDTPIKKAYMHTKMGDKFISISICGILSDNIFLDIDSRFELAETLRDLAHFLASERD